MACEAARIDAPGFEPGRDWREEAAREAVAHARAKAGRWRTGTAAAEDIGQEAAIRCLTGVVHFAGSAKAYGRRAAWTEFHSYYRESRRRRDVANRVGDVVTAQLAHAAPPPPADEALAHHQILVALREEIAALPPARRAAVETALSGAARPHRASPGGEAFRSSLRDGRRAVEAAMHDRYPEAL